MTRNELTKLWAKVTGKFNALIGGAPEALDTLKEIADKLGDDDDALAGLLTQVGSKQDALVSGQNIKSINGQSVLGSGNLELGELFVVRMTRNNSNSVYTADKSVSEIYEASYTNGKPVIAVMRDISNPVLILTDCNPDGDSYVFSAIESNTVTTLRWQRTDDYTYELETIVLQPHLVSGTNIKTLNNESLLGSGNVTIAGKSAYQSYVDTTTDNPPKTEAEWVASLKGEDGVSLGEVAIADDLDTDDARKVLSARQGYNLGQKVNDVDAEPIAGSEKFVKSGGVQNELALGAVYDVSAKNPTAGINNDGKWESLSTLLSDANLNNLIPTSVRKGGMSIKFVQTSDNKYVQYRLMDDDWSTNTEDWAVADEGVYVENPEFVRAIIDNKNKILEAIRVDGTKVLPAGVKINDKIDFEGNKTTIIENPEFITVKLDAEGKILWAIKIDGTIFYGAGCPPQVKEYLESKISELQLTSVPDILTFLGNIEGTTLADLLAGKVSISDLEVALATKVDKEEGKSLIDADYAESISSVENPEYMQVETDSEGKILEGIKSDGTKVIAGDTQIRGNATILGNIDIQGATYTLMQNPEWIRVIVDAQDRILYGIREGGGVYINSLTEIPSIIQEAIDNLSEKVNALDAVFQIVDNPEYIAVETDSEDKILSGRNTDGSKFENFPMEFRDKISINGSIIENILDPEGRTEIKTDSGGKIFSYRDSEGVLHEEVGIESTVVNTGKLNLTETGMIEFQQALINAGFNPKSVIDWSDQTYIHIPQKPTCAVINITGIDNLPQEKGVNSHAWMEVWDKNGNYFKKRVILDAQGRSSLHQTKKNFAADFCEDEWEGDDTTTIKIGDWVSQDSFHFKAYYTDMFKMANVISYKLWQDFKDTMPFTENKPYKEYFANNYTSTESGIDDFTQNSKDEAKCVPDGFPVVVYLNGTFYGLFVWQLKKHRDNYMLDRNSTSNIHLDGEDYVNMFNGTIDCSKLEIRNPKPKKSKWTLYCMDGSKYDGDNPKELIDSNSELWDETNVSHVKSSQLKANIIALSQYMGEIATFEATYNNASPEDKPAALETLKAEIEKRFGVKWIIDYVILINLELNGDSITQNTQWITWGKINNKIKWFPCPYDLDASFGIVSTTSFRFNAPRYAAIGSNSSTPIRYIYSYYNEELEARWKELRDKKIIDKESFINTLTNWIFNIGNNNFEMEYDKWSESPCNRDSAIDNRWEFTNNQYISYSSANSWYPQGIFAKDRFTKYNNKCYKSLQANNTNHRPDISPEWWEDMTVKAGTYAQGDLVYDGYNNFYQFRAKEAITVTEDVTSINRQDHLLNTPFIKLYSSYPNEGGVYDSLYRIYKWIEEQINILDIEYNYL